MKKKFKKNQKLKASEMETKQGNFRVWKKAKHWVYAASALTVLVGGIAGTSFLLNQPIVVQALTLPSGVSQIGTIGSAPVLKVSNNSFSSMQPLFDDIMAGKTPAYIAGDTQNGTGGEAVGWNSKTTYDGTPLGNIDSLISGNNGLNHTTVQVALEDKDGFTDSDNFNYVSQGGVVGIHNVGTAYDVATGQNIPIGMKLTIDDATMYDATGDQTAQDVFSQGYRLLVAIHNVNGNITVGYVPVMDGVGTSGSGGIGGEGGGSTGGGEDTSGTAAGYPASVRATVTLVNEATGEALPNNTLMAMKMSDIDTNQAFQISGQALAYLVSSDTDLSIKSNILTAGNGTVVSDPNNLNAHSYIALVNANDVGTNIVDTAGNQNQGSIIGAYFGQMGTTSPRLGFVENTLTKSETGDSEPSGVSQANAQYEIKNTNTGKLVIKSDAQGTAFKAYNGGSVSYDSAGNLIVTSGTAGKASISNLPSFGSDGKAIKYQWVEVKAPNGEAINSDGPTFTANPKSDKVDTNGNFETTGTKISDKTILELDVKKKSTNAAFNNVMAGATYVAYANGEPIKTADGLNPADSTTQDVKVAAGTLASGADISSLLATNSGVSDEGTDSAAMPFQSAVSDFNASNVASYDSHVSSYVADGDLTVVADSAGDIDVQDIDGTKIGYGADITLKEVAPAPGHAYNDDKDKSLDSAWSPSTYSSDKSNLMAALDTTDAPMGETAVGNFDGNKPDQGTDTNDIDGKEDADTSSTTTQGDGLLQGAEVGLFVETSTSGSTTIQGEKYDGTWVAVKQSQGVNPETGESAKVVNTYGSKYASDADDNVVLVSDKNGNFGGVKNMDLSQYLNYGWLELKAPYGYTRNTHMSTVDFALPDKVDPKTNNYEDHGTDYWDVDKSALTTPTTKSSAISDGVHTIKDNIVDFKLAFYKTESVNGTGLNGATFKARLATDKDMAGLPAAIDSLGKFDNSASTDINNQDYYTSAQTGLMTPVTSPNQLQLGATQTSHDFTTPDGNTKAGLVEWDHLQLAPYVVEETTPPAGEKAVGPFLIVPTAYPDTTGAPDQYTFTIYDMGNNNKVVDKQTVKVDYNDSGTASDTNNPDDTTVNLTNDNNGLISLNLGNMNDQPTTPSIDVEKANGSMPKAGNGDNTDKPNNDGSNDHDTAATADVLKPGDKTTIYFNETNNGTEPLTDVTASDTTTNGKAKIDGIVWTYNGQKLSMNSKGQFLDPTKTDGTLLILPPDKDIQGTGTLEALATGATTADKATVSGVGTISGEHVGDSDDWYGKVPKPVIPGLPDTGDVIRGGLTLLGLALISFVVYVKRETLAKLFRGKKAK